MIASQNCEPLWEPHLECDKESDSLDRVVSTIDVVAHEEVVGLRWLATDLEELAEIVELAVDVTTNGHRGRNCLHI